MTFDLFPWRFGFVAREPFDFPAGGAANAIRGALGARLHAMSLDAYQAVFAPTGARGGPSGFAHPPRPFVLRAGHLEGARFAGGEPLFLDVHVFELRRPTLQLFTEALSRLAGGRATLASVWQLDSNKETQGEAAAGGCPVSLPLDLPSSPVEAVEIRFVTPVELKGNGTGTAPADFGTLFCRARDRVSTLRALYGHGPLDIPFREMADRARAVRTVAADLHHVDLRRRSSSTAKVHPLGGFTGEARYEGDLTEFLPILQAATWTGIGRQTVWGKGAFEITAR